MAMDVFLVAMLAVALSITGFYVLAMLHLKGSESNSSRKKEGNYHANS